MALNSVVAMVIVAGTIAFSCIIEIDQPLNTEMHRDPPCGR
jgi:hypothetical protein